MGFWECTPYIFVIGSFEGRPKLNSLEWQMVCIAIGKPEQVFISPVRFKQQGSEQEKTLAFSCPVHDIEDGKLALGPSKVPSFGTFLVATNLEKFQRLRCSQALWWSWVKRDRTLLLE